MFYFLKRGFSFQVWSLFVKIVHITYISWAFISLMPLIYPSHLYAKHLHSSMLMQMYCKSGTSCMTHLFTLMWKVTQEQAKVSGLLGRKHTVQYAVGYLWQTWLQITADCLVLITVQRDILQMFPIRRYITVLYRWLLHPGYCISVHLIILQI